MTQPVALGRRSWVRSPLWPPAPFWVGVSLMWPAAPEVMVFPLCRVCGSKKKYLGTRPRYSLVVDEDVKKPSKHTLTQLVGIGSKDRVMRPLEEWVACSADWTIPDPLLLWNLLCEQFWHRFTIVYFWTVSNVYSKLWFSFLFITIVKDLFFSTFGGKLSFITNSTIHLSNLNSIDICVAENPNVIMHTTVYPFTLLCPLRSLFRFLS